MMKILEVLIQIIKLMRIHLIVILMTKRSKQIMVTLKTSIWNSISSGENKIQMNQNQMMMKNLRMRRDKKASQKMEVKVNEK